ncbi:MAG TPA: DUF2339 domain-containing protein [Alphaproteobacteria bacterium]|nr:DUF2339 domain-containing protein [Alphaproteobacteria bacterium]
MTYILIIVILLIVWRIAAPFAITNELKTRVARLEREVAALKGAALPDSAVAPAVPAQPVIAQPEPVLIEAASVEAAPAEPAQPPSLPPSTLIPATTVNWEAIERWIVERWIIAVGGVTAALGGLFIVRYSIEQGWLGPEGRVLLGSLVGLGFVAAAEWVRRRTAAQTDGTGETQVPAALSAAGLVTLYGVTYAAYSFYGLIPPTVTFLLLALVAFGSLGAGLVYGRLAAALGTAMGLIAPALVASDSPDATILFPYLFFVTGGVFALIRYRRWPWLACLALAGNGIWQLSWMLSVGSDQPLVRVIHLIAVPALSAVLLLSDPWPEPASPWWRWDWSKAPLPVWTVAATVLGSFALLWMLAAGTGYDGVAATGWGIGIALLMLLARFAPTQQPLAVVVALMTVGLAASWSVPAMPHDDDLPWAVTGPLLAPALEGYATPIAAYAAMFGIGGFALLWRSLQPGLWAGLSAAVPIALTAVLYARLADLTRSLSWASVGIGLAGLALIAAGRTARHRPRLDAPLAAYAAAVTAALALAATMALHTAWLTVALSLELPALAWIYRRTRTADTGVPGLRVLAGIIAAILAVRLLLNPSIGGYGGDMPILINWLAYGYGVPALACWLAARWFGPDSRTAWVEPALQSAALAFATALMTLELWHIASGGGELFAHGEPLRQAAATGDGWLALALFLLRLERTQSQRVRDWGWRAIGAVGLGWTLLITLLGANPYLNGFEVGDLPVLNLVLLAYGLPAALLALGASELARQRHFLISRIVAASSVVTAIVTVLLEIRQAFHGSRLDEGDVGQAEAYSYSAGLLLVSVALLLGGLRWPKSDLRLAGFGLLALTLGKAFLIDMDDLTGLWRAASFLGLGLCLIGIGYAYQKLQGRTPATQH